MTGLKITYRNIIHDIFAAGNQTKKHHQIIMNKQWVSESCLLLEEVEWQEQEQLNQKEGLVIQETIPGVVSLGAQNWILLLN